MMKANSVLCISELKGCFLWYSCTDDHQKLPTCVSSVYNNTLFPAKTLKLSAEGCTQTPDTSNFLWRLLLYNWQPAIWRCYPHSSAHQRDTICPLGAVYRERLTLA